ncbi:SRPBCC family protein [Bradyrhizobium sp. HKCCYLRH3061]|uniref:SRPBCC family protein n=1 Tax=Bradyrhizobium sp. HKCCYLRH3061 TaxID=3420734 RepID=UPI003EB9F1C8
MASIQKDIPIAAPAAAVWDAVRDFGAVHTRVARGFVTDTRLDGDVRIVSFANGSVTREQLVDCNDQRRRLVYAIKNERISQHSASFQIIPDGEERCRVIWTTDVLPNEIAPYIEQQMELGARAMQDTLGRLRG